MQKVMIVIFGGLLVAMSGCAIPQTKALTLNIDTTKSSVLTYPAQIRGAYFFRPEDHVKMCSEPVPDVAMESLEKLAASLKAKTAADLTIEPSLAYELNSKAVELAGRTQLVLLAREMLFRACELSINGSGSSELSKQIFEKVVDVIGEIAKTDQTKADTAKVKAEKEKAEAEAELVKAKKALGVVLDGDKKKKGEDK
ncbi:hypothetical protein [Geobacter sp. SVR]|uniref:hypothetical protein n=1 Tax=Geobacter sp. SVR TaxID=2495594 RepID=UPI00143EF6C5|nr:hypothetical protein [Geobacter sp. SVR]BCS53133.1 hypothetical protein GSVR_14410 [Geobacter sp. SVR]GCF84518.1 hypothetical protein GSbR_11180 [Geobacter sp. SVR]